MLHSPVIADVIDLCKETLGAERAAQLAGEAAVRAVYNVMGAAEFPSGEPSAAVEQVWWYLWRALAAERPEGFRPNARSLSPSRPGALMYAYAQKNEPDAFFPLPLNAAEHVALKTARHAVRNATGLAGLARARRVMMFTQECRTLRNIKLLPGYENGPAWCTAVERFIVFDGEFVARCRASGEHRLPLIVLHEEVHAAMTASVKWPARNLDDLVVNLQEPAAVASQFYADQVLRDEKPTLTGLRRLSIDHPDGRTLRKLMSLGPNGSVNEFLDKVIRAAQAGLRLGSHPRLARELNRIFCQTRSLKSWERLVQT